MNNKKEIVEYLIDVLDNEYRSLLQPIMKTRSSCISEIIIKVNKLLPLIINENYNLAVFLLEKAEELLLADSGNDIIKLIDILRYEMKPELLEYLNDLK